MNFNARPFRPPRAHHTNFSLRNQNMWKYRNTWPRPPALLSESLLLPPPHQPPPMFGPRGATIPPRFYQSSMTQNPYNNFNHGNENHWCETCDRGFKNKSLLENHMKEHQRCNIDGCSFIAHPKVITKHIQMQHSSGLYSKISKLNDPEEIKKWREERRKKFPTKANIEQKKAEVKEKIERGEKMGLRNKKFPDNFHNQKNKIMGSRKKTSIRKRPRKTENFCAETKPKHNLPPFTGIRELCTEHDPKDQENLANNESFIIEDEIDTVEFNGEVEYNPVSVCGAINKLIADYKSSTEEDSEKDERCKTSIANNSKIMLAENKLSNSENTMKINETKEDYKDNLKNEIHSNICESNGSDSGPEEIKILKTTERVPMDININKDTNNSNESCKKLDNSTQKKTNTFVKIHHNLKKKLPSTLLQKLLANEIKHERNVTLQCIRYIVKNNYFDQ